jgi:hypothetical protein
LQRFIVWWRVGLKGPGSTPPESLWSRRQLSRALSRQQRKELAQKLHAADPGLTIVHPDAAGIDVGNDSHFVAVPAGRDAQRISNRFSPMGEFGRWPNCLRSTRVSAQSCEGAAKPHQHSAVCRPGGRLRFGDVRNDQQRGSSTKRSGRPEAVVLRSRITPSGERVCPCDRGEKRGRLVFDINPISSQRHRGGVRDRRAVVDGPPAHGPRTTARGRSLLP